MGVRSPEEIEENLENEYNKLKDMVEDFSERLRKEFPDSDYSVIIFPKDLTLYDLLTKTDEFYI